MKCKLADIAEFNPKESLKKGNVAKKVAMDQLRPFYRDIPGYTLEPFNGGAKFRNGDTIMARITPCLENGKTAKVNILDNGEIGFGSTEYIVFRAKEGISDEDYLYYLICSPIVRDAAIKSMVGSSGRQRVQTDVLQNLEIDLPSITEQKKIGALLRSLDDKIELNNKINENLEQQAQAIYQEWFGNINIEKEQGALADICTYSKDRVSVSELDVSTYFSTENMLPGKAGATEASSLPTTAQATACHVGDTLISNIRPYFRKIVYCHEVCGCSTDVLCFVPVHPKYSAYLYSTLYADRFFDFMVAGSKGTKMPRGDKQQIMTYPVTLPTDTELEKFNSAAVPILTQIQNNRNENQRLSALRDTLLPKLMNGEIVVNGI